MIHCLVNGECVASLFCLHVIDFNQHFHNDNYAQ